MIRARCVLLALATLSLLAGAPCGFTQPLKPPLIVISLDGFRADYYDRGLTPTLAALARDGAHARAMRPSFPSVTEPNHYTLMTGLYPDHHGVVDNTMVDPAMPGLAFGGPHGHGVDMDMDPRWWNEATPLWVSAERRGLKTASSLWPGDQAVIHGVAPTYLQDRAHPVSMDKQVETVLGWLDLPAGQRPALIRVHFGLVDDMGHLFGPDSSSVNAAVAKVDAELGKLVEGLKAKGLFERVNIVVVSDHGMAATPPDKILFLDDLIDLKTVSVPAYGAEAGVDPATGHEAAIEKIMLAPHEHMRCWRRRDIPARLHYGHNPRVPAIVCLADVGWSIATREQVAQFPPLHGNHGYDPDEPTMAALFVAHGPAFKAGVTLPAFDNVDVYPLLAKVLGVPAQSSDGQLSAVAAGLNARR